MASSLAVRAVDALTDLPSCRIHHSQLEYDTRKWLGDKLISAEVASRLVSTKSLSTAGELTAKHSKIVDRHNMAKAFHELVLRRFVTVTNDKEHDLADGLEALCAWLHACKDSRAQLAFAAIVDVLVDNGIRAHLDASQHLRPAGFPSSSSNLASSSERQATVDLLDLHSGAEGSEVGKPTNTEPVSPSRQQSFAEVGDLLDSSSLAELQHRYQLAFKSAPQWGTATKNPEDEQMFSLVINHAGKEFSGGWAKGKSESRRLALLQLLRTLSVDK
jgi:dsRNA-specific ribonuclease